MDRGAWWATVHEVTKESDTTERQSPDARARAHTHTRTHIHTHTHTHTLHTHTELACCPAGPLC